LVIYILYGIFFLSCIVLIASVLLQPGKTDAGALFTSNISSSAFNPRGTQTVLSKITIVAAACFMVSALLLSMPALTGDVSVLSTTSAEQPAQAPADANSNTNTAAGDANANTNANANPAFVEIPPANANVASNVVPANTAKPANANAAPKKDASKPADKKK
jgi:protein translocase SecG subunit